MQCDQIWRNFTTFAKVKKPWQYLEGLFGIRVNFEPVLANFKWAIGHILIIPNDQILKTNLPSGHTVRLLPAIVETTRIVKYTVLKER